MLNIRLPLANVLVVIFVSVVCSIYSSPSTRYKHHLALIVVVDKENHTQIAMQALLSHERTEDFVFLFKVFKELIGGVQPQVNQLSKRLFDFVAHEGIMSR